MHETSSIPRLSLVGDVTSALPRLGPLNAVLSAPVMDMGQALPYGLRPNDELPSFCRPSALTSLADSSGWEPTRFDVAVTFAAAAQAAAHLGNVFNDLAKTIGSVTRTVVEGRGHAARHEAAGKGSAFATANIPFGSTTGAALSFRRIAAPVVSPTARSFVASTAVQSSSKTSGVAQPHGTPSKRDGGILKFIDDGLDLKGRIGEALLTGAGIYHFATGRSAPWLAEHVPWPVGKGLAKLSLFLRKQTRPALRPIEKFLKDLPKSRAEADEFMARIAKLLPRRTPAEGAPARAMATRAAEGAAGKVVAGGVAKRLLGGATARIGGKLLGATLPGVDLITWPLLLDDIGAVTYAEEMKNPHFRAIADLQSAFNSPGKMAALPAWELSLALQDTEAKIRKMERDDPRVTRRFRPYGALSRAVGVITAEQDRRRKLGIRDGGGALRAASGRSPIAARSDGSIAARLTHPPIKSVRAVPNSIAHAAGFIGKIVPQRPSESSALGHANVGLSGAKGLTASVHAATTAPNNFAQRGAHVPTNCCCAPTQVQTTINLDGRTIATAVSKHQARSISGPRGSYLRPDPNAALHTSSSVYGT
jgi:hypothetical protein